MFGKPKVVWSVISSLLGPVFLLFGLGGVDGLLHERVLRPACASVLLTFHFYPSVADRHRIFLPIGSLPVGGQLRA